MSLKRLSFAVLSAVLISPLAAHSAMTSPGIPAPRMPRMSPGIPAPRMPRLIALSPGIPAPRMPRMSPGIPAPRMPRLIGA
jgi:hypothetical protein